MILVKPIKTAAELTQVPARTVMRSAHGTALQTGNDGVIFAAGSTARYDAEQAVRFFAPIDVIAEPKVASPRNKA